MPSCIASSFSHGDAFISSKPERTTTFTSSPPRRRELRQQSIAVLPPPSTMTRLPILSMWPNDTDDSQSMPMWMFFAASRGRECRGRGRAARRCRRRSRRSLRASSAFMRVDARAAAELDAEVEDVADLLVDHRVGQAELRDLRAHHAAGLRVAVEHDAVVAERREIARDGERRGPAADQRDALAVPRLRAAWAAARGCRPCSRPRRASAGRSRPARAWLRLAVIGRALLDAPAPARGLARAVAGAAEDAREHVRLPVDHVGVAVAARARSAGCIRGRAYGPGTPTGNRRLCGNSRVPRYPSASILFLTSGAPGLWSSGAAVFFPVADTPDR